MSGSLGTAIIHLNDGQKIFADVANVDVKRHTQTLWKFGDDSIDVVIGSEVSVSLMNTRFVPAPSQKRGPPPAAPAIDQTTNPNWGKF